MRRALLLVLGFAALGEPHRSGAQEVPAASVQIVNATSVPEISLSIDGRNDYPNFPQGRMTAGAALERLKATYAAKDRQTGARGKPVELPHDSRHGQTIVILGDFSTVAPPGRLPQPGDKAEETYPPNLLFKVYSHEVPASEQPLRLRIINGMPGQSLLFVAGHKPRVLLPGEDFALFNQPAVAQYTAKANGHDLQILMRQEEHPRNALLVFFLKEGKPAFMRAFEGTSEKPADE